MEAQESHPSPDSTASTAMTLPIVPQARRRRRRALDALGALDLRAIAWPVQRAAASPRGHALGAKVIAGLFVLVLAGFSCLNRQPESEGASARGVRSAAPHKTLAYRVRGAGTPPRVTCVTPPSPPPETVMASAAATTPPPSAPLPAKSAPVGKGTSTPKAVLAARAAAHTSTPEAPAIHGARHHATPR